MSDGHEVFWLLRYLPPKTTGVGEIVACLSAPDDWSMERWREAHPELFETHGFYALMVSTGGNCTIGPSKEKN